MLMDWGSLVGKYGLDKRVTGVVHCGAHVAEEAGDYAAAGISNVWWIEGNPDLIPVVQLVAEQFGHHVISALLGEKDDQELVFNITNQNGMSSSVLQFGTHPTFSPETVYVEAKTLRTKTIDTLVEEHGIHDVNMLCMDLQGYEGWVLRGAAQLLPKIDVVMSEVNSKDVYIGCTKVDELDAILFDFDRVETYWVGDNGWGDALWIRRET